MCLFRSPNLIGVMMSKTGRIYSAYALEVAAAFGVMREMELTRITEYTDKIIRIRVTSEKGVPFLTVRVFQIPPQGQPPLVLKALVHDNELIPATVEGMRLVFMPGVKTPWWDRLHTLYLLQRTNSTGWSQRDYRHFKSDPNWSQLE